ncbi:MAG: TMEM43 family protein, partial [Clostridia bacterium]|nr:TMEM43 family protein [Clostridia bacterium]
DAQKELLSTGAAVALGETVSLPTGYYKVNNYIASVDNLANAKVGDVRISFRYNNDKEISVLAKQSGSSFLPFTSKQGKNMFEVRSGIMTGEAIIDAVEKENNILKWILRFVGTVLNMAGFAALLSPIAFLVKWIPLLGKGIAKVIGWIGGLVGLAVSLIVIAIAWLFFRPLVAILLFVGVGGSIALVAMLIKKSRGMEDPNQVAVAGVPGMTMAMPTDGVQPMMQQPVMGSQPVGQPMPGQFPNNNGQM